LASKSLGLSEDVLRRSKRELVLCSQVVVKAQKRAAGGVTPTLRVLIDCLPEITEAGDWTRQLALACAQAGGLEEVTVENVMDVTNYSYNTARQYLIQSKHLLRIAATVMLKYQRQQQNQNNGGTPPLVTTTDETNPTRNSPRNTVMVFKMTSHTMSRCLWCMCTNAAVDHLRGWLTPGVESTLLDGAGLRFQWINH